MPSLKALREVKSSFANMGNESENRIEQNLPEDDLQLPENEAAVDTTETAETTEDLLSFGDLGDLLGSSPDLTESDLTGPGLTDAQDITETEDLPSKPDAMETVERRNRRIWAPFWIQSRTIWECPLIIKYRRNLKKVPRTK